MLAPFTLKHPFFLFFLFPYLTSTYYTSLLVVSISLIVRLGFCGPWSQVPAATALIITLMLNCHFAEMSDDVLHMSIRSAAGFATKVVQPLDLVHEEVNNGNDDLGYISKFKGP